jgi:hypothetical protein
MRVENFCFGSIDIDGRTYAHDVVIDRGQTQRPEGVRGSSPREAW